MQQIEEVRQVGSFKKGTMLKGRNKADLVVILKTLPTIESVRALGSKLLEEVVKMDASSGHQMESVDSGHQLESVDSGHQMESVHQLEVVDGGFEIIMSSATVRILVTTTMHNMRRIDPQIHISVRFLQRNMAAIRHVRWFEDSANLTTIKVLIRILRDTRTRFEGLFMLSPWMVDVLAHYSVLFRHSEQLLSLASAFKRVFQLLSSGLFLPGSTGIPDPCENGAITLHTPLTNSQMDRLSMTSQTLLRVLSQPNGFNFVLGFEPDSIGITTNQSRWEDVTVVPSTPVAATVATLVSQTEENGRETKNGQERNFEKSSENSSQIENNEGTDTKVTE